MTTDAPPTAGSSEPEERLSPSERTPAMDIATVRQSLRQLSVAMTVMVLVAIPALFAAVSIRALHEHAVLDAALVAERVAEHVQSAGLEWRQAPDLQQVLGIAPTSGIQIERTLIGPEGGVLIPPPNTVARPVMRVRAPVMASGTRVAEVAVAVSLWSTVVESAMVLMVAVLFSVGLYLVIDRVALRVLRNALDHLQTALRERDKALQETSEALTMLGRQNARLKTTSEELARARDAALSADRSKSMFLAAMSHELRTPLNAIIGFSEVMARQLYGPIGHDKYRDYAADIRASGDHLLALIDDVLDLSRVEAGKLSLRREPLDVAEQVEACHRLIQGRASDAGIDLQLAPRHAYDTVILGDRVRFRQILLNLLTNAIKFTEHGGRVRIETDAVAGGKVLVRISDTGVGMSEVDLERVFRPFERVDVGTSRPTEGAGLGLALCRALVREHDGNLHIASQPGEGTTVTLTFPRLGGDGAADPGRQISLGDALGGGGDEAR